MKEKETDPIPEGNFLFPTENLTIGLASNKKENEAKNMKKRKRSFSY